MPIRVLIVDDSIIFRTKIQNILNEDGEVEVVGTAGNPIDAVPMIEKLKPDVISLDVEMPRMSGIDFLKLLHSQTPYPTILVSSLPLNKNDAIKYGAIDFVSKPDLREKDSLITFANNLKEAVKRSKYCKIPTIKATDTPVKPIESNLKYTYNRDLLIAIGASTGGTEAIIEVVKDLPENTPGIVIVQHLPANFTELYTNRLNSACKMKVKTAQNLDRIKQGQIILANGDHQMSIRRDREGLYINSIKGERVSGHCPSVDVMFGSIADTCANTCIGVMLTGMGADGAMNMKKMRDKGAYTIGQDQKTSIVYGMPMEAYKNGSIIRQLPLNKISEEILNHLRTKYK